MSVRPVTDREAVLRAMAEHDRLGRDAFFERYGFVRSTRYEVVHEDQPYDPAAILAVAHREQHGRVLASGEVEAAVKQLRALDFVVEHLTPPWHEDEMVLALDVYLRHRGQRISRTHAEARRLSERLWMLAEQRGLRPRHPFRDPEGMEQQLGKFLDLDPTSTIKGRGDPSKLHRAVWERYWNDRPRLEQRVSAILGSLGVPRHEAPRGEPPSIAARDAPRARRKLSIEELSAPFDPEAEPVRPEAAEPSRPDPEAQLRANTTHRELLLGLEQRLRMEGFTCRSPPRARGDLRYDLLATRERLTLLVEVKSLPPGGNDHDQLRLGLGQVLWYRGRWREDCDDPCVAVLYVEREPADATTWLAVCGSASVVLMWPHRIGTLVEECARIATPGLGRYAKGPE